MITVANADKALKTYYLDAVSEQLNAVSPFYAAIEKNNAEVYGKEVKVSVVRGDNGRVMAVAEDGDLPAAGSNRYLTLTAPLKNIYGTIEISDKALRASANSDGAFVNLVNAEMEGLVASAKATFSRMLYGDGNGLVAYVISNSSGKCTLNSVSRVYVGMHVDLRGATGVPSDCENVEITAIDRTANTVTFGSAITSNIVGSGMYLHGVYGNEITGFGALFSTNDIYGNTRSSDSYLQANDFVEHELTEKIIADKIGYLEQYFGSRPNMLLCSYKTQAAIATMLSESRMQVNTSALSGGYSAVTFSGIPVVADRYCDDGMIYMLNTDDFCLAQLCDWSWLEDEDGKILKQIPGKAAYSATLVKYAELICKKPCGQALLRGFSV